MRRRIVWLSCITAVIAAASIGKRLTADGPFDFGLAVEQALSDHSLELFGVQKPLKKSALGPYNGADSTLAVIAAKGLDVSVVSTATHPESDQIALWPDDDHPTHLFTCAEITGAPASGPALPVVERVDLSSRRMRTSPTSSPV